MVLYRGKDGQLQMDRRSADRCFIVREAELVTADAVLRALITDLSSTGARLEMEHLPDMGATARLRWQSHDHGCTVQWVADGSCGLAFDQALPAAALDQSSPAETARKTRSRKRAPLTIGKKRSGSLANL